jgi:exopolyphosphatase/pppGpp-phosphohydrolase
MRTMDTVAAIDIGSNAVHLLISNPEKEPAAPKSTSFRTGAEEKT